MKRTSALLLGALVASLSFAFAPTYDAKLFAEMRWRSIGPLRAGRTKSAQGIAGQPIFFYTGVAQRRYLENYRAFVPHLRSPSSTIAASQIDRLYSRSTASNPAYHLRRACGEGRQPDVSTGDGVYKSSTVET
jgi:hypothetical protein